MLHGPWVADMLNAYLVVGTGGGGGTGPVELDLSTFINLYNSTTWDGTDLKPVSTTGNSADFTFDIVMDPTKTYTVEVDYTVTQGTIGTFILYSLLAPTTTGANNSEWHDLHVSGGLSGSGTLTFDIGPGIEDWDLAVTDGEHYMVYSATHYVTVSRIQLDDGSVAGPPSAPVIKALAVKSAHVPSANTAFRSGIANEITGTGYTAGGVEVTGVTVAWDAATSRAYVTCDVVDFGAVTATDVAGVVFYVDNGSAATDRVLWTDTFPPVDAAGALTYQPSEDGAMEIRV